MIDLRTLRPLDTATILESVGRTHRAVVVDEGWRSGSLSAEVAARIAEEAFYDLDAPVARVCQRRGPDPVRQAPRGGGPPAGGVDRGGRPPDAWGPEVGDFLMPSLGADMDSGTVIEWRVQPGDVVHRGDIVAVVDTEKSDIEVEVFEDGVVEALLVEVGEEVAVGTPLARLAAAGGPPPTALPRSRHRVAEGDEDQAAGEGPEARRRTPPPSARRRRRPPTGAPPASRGAEPGGAHVDLRRVERLRTGWSHPRRRHRTAGDVTGARPSRPRHPGPTARRPCARPSAS